MRKYYTFFIFIIIIVGAVISCSENESDEYIPVAPDPVSLVVLDLSRVPYPKLSDYHFFKDSLKNLEPVYKVIPFKPASELFSDYARKKRFVWMPRGSKATYNSDETILELPVGAALIKTFYYENVQNTTPVGATRIIETRVMIKKAVGWIFADYVWNAEQTEAYYDVAGSQTSVSWMDDNNNIRTAEYRIPELSQCKVCHKFRETVGNQEVTVHIPIGIKPQNLNFELDYGTSTKNQLIKWIEEGYLDGNFSLPTANKTVINYNDTSKPLEVRARAYVDANCSHCHQQGRHCDYRPMRFAFGDTDGNRTNMGACVPTSDMQGFPEALGQIVTPGNISKSMLYHRLNTVNEVYRMPLHGRTMLHDEGIALMGQWINSLEPCN